MLRLGETERVATEVVAFAEAEKEGTTKGALPPLAPPPEQEPEMAVVAILARADTVKAIVALADAVGRPLPPLPPPPEEDPDRPVVDEADVKPS